MRCTRYILSYYKLLSGGTTNRLSYLSYLTSYKKVNLVQDDQDGMDKAMASAEEAMAQSYQYALINAVGVQQKHTYKNPEQNPDRSDDTLRSHRICDFLETCDIRTGDVVAFHAIALCSLITACEDIIHNSLQHVVNFLKGPGKTF